MHHSLCHYWEPEGPSECRHFLLWWYFLHLSKPVLPDIQHTHSHRRCHDTSYSCLPPWKQSSHLHQILHSHQRQDCWFGLSISTNQYYGRLRDSSSQLHQRGFSWHQHQGMFFPHPPEYMEKSTGNRTSNTISRRRRRQDFGLTSSNSTAYTSCISWRRLALGLRRPRKRRHHSVNSILYWLCYWPMGRRRQIFMESLWNRGTTHHQQHWRMAQQT